MYSCTSEGQPLVEVFGVRFLPAGAEAPAGTVSVFDGKRGQIIYSGGAPVDEPCSVAVKQRRPGGRLPLTGPYRAISADGCVAIVLDLHHHDTAAPPPPPASSSHVAGEILLDVYAETTRYDVAITSAVSGTGGDGRAGAEVTYALLSDAAEAIVEVRLLGRRAGRTVGGTVVARTVLGEVVLFDDDGASVGPEEEDTGIVPLARSVVAVPLASSLKVELDLVVDGGGDGEVMKESVACVPKLGSEEVCRLPPGGVGAVEVKVTWLD